MSNFEDGVNALMPLKPGLASLPSGGNATAGKFPRFTGTGLVVEEADAGGGGYGVFITDIVPTFVGTVANKVYTDTSVLVSCESDTQQITVSVLAFTGKTHLIPVVTVNGAAVTNLVLNSQMRWAGSVAITAASTSIVIVHEDGGSYTTTMSAAVGPDFTAFNLTGGYPGSQTEVKAGDTYNIVFTPNMSVNALEVADFEAASVLSQALTPGAGPFTVAITVAARGAGTVANQRVKIRCRSLRGIWGNYILSDVYGSGDGSAHIQLNNDVPVISAIAQGNISYPVGQAALKDTEIATVNHTVTCPSGSFSIVYSSPGELTPTNPTVYEAAKIVTRNSGTYNISVNNLTITATKITNNKVATRSVVVYIANTLHNTNITLPYARLRSSPAGTDYTVTITCSQQLSSAPVLASLVSGQGTWQGAAFAGSGTTWTRTVRIADADSKGTFTFTGLTSTNLAGKVSHAITSGASYILGGFTFRVLTVAAWPNRETAIGTSVVTTSKLRCTNLSKGASGSLNYTYQNTLADILDTYDITQPSGVLNTTGNLWRNNDLPNSVSNTSGSLAIECEEVV